MFPINDTIFFSLTVGLPSSNEDTEETECSKVERARAQARWPGPEIWLSFNKEKALRPNPRLSDKEGLGVASMSRGEGSSAVS